MTESLHDRLHQQDLANVSDETATVILNTPDDSMPLMYQDAELLDLANVLRLAPRGANEDSNELSALIKASRDHSDPVVQHAAIALHEFLQVEPDANTLGWGDSETCPVRVNAILATLNSAGIVSIESSEKLMATAQRHQSWAETNLGRPVTIHEVSMAR